MTMTSPNLNFAVLLLCLTVTSAFVGKNQNKRSFAPLKYVKGHDENEEQNNNLPIHQKPCMIPKQPSPEWHDSFLRNGLADFVPPMSDYRQLDCLVLGENYGDTVRQLLPWEFQDSTTRIHALPLIEHGVSDQDAEGIVKHQPLTSLTHQPQYDCIFDRGLMDAMVCSSSAVDTEIVMQLLEEASLALKEHGIYVMATKEDLSTAMKQYLNLMGSDLGLYWKFELDGITDDSMTVSVARRYPTDPLPSFGKLATVIQSAIKEEQGGKNSYINTPHRNKPPGNP